MILYRILPKEKAPVSGYLGAKTEKADFDIVMTGVPVLEDGAVTIVTPDRRVAINPEVRESGVCLRSAGICADPDHLQKVAKELGTLCAVEDKNIDYSYIGKKKDFLRTATLRRPDSGTGFHSGIQYWLISERSVQGDRKMARAPNGLRRNMTVCRMKRSYNGSKRRRYKWERGDGRCYLRERSQFLRSCLFCFCTFGTDK